MGWAYKPTGDMTLSVVDDGTGKRIFTVKMLSAGTMKAGAGGDLLAAAENDLSLLAQIPNLLAGGEMLPPPHPDVDYRPFPWTLKGLGAVAKHIVAGDGHRIAALGTMKHCSDVQAGLDRINASAVGHRIFSATSYKATD